MNRLAGIFRTSFLRSFRWLRRDIYCQTFRLSNARHILTTTANFIHFTTRVIGATLRTRRLYDTPKITCWKCDYSYSAGTTGETVFFCPSCNVVQELSQDKTYFDIMNCEQKFDLDTKYLTQQFRNLQSLLHPDKFSQKQEREQQLSSLQSSLVNEAYQTLLKPLNRGLYLLELEGMTIEEGNVGNDVEFLSEVMEMNEMLESGPEETLKNLQSRIEDNLQLYTEKASTAFTKYDFVEAKEILSKMRYYDNISKQIREKIIE